MKNNRNRKKKINKNFTSRLLGDNWHPSKLPPKIHIYYNKIQNIIINFFVNIKKHNFFE